MGDNKANNADELKVHHLYEIQKEPQPIIKCV